MKVMLWVAVLCLPLCKSSFAQVPTNVAVKILKETMNKYRDPGFISFEMDCKYSPETSPFEFLDSLKGGVKMSGNKYWYKMQETETVYTGDYVISIFNEEKIMHLVKVPPQKEKLPAAAPMDNPVLDELDTLLREKVVGLELKESDRMYIVSIDFLAPSIYKKMEYTIDKKSKLILKIAQIVRTSELMGPEFRGTDADSGYALVQTFFHHYSSDTFDESLFASDRFFRMQSGQYVPASTYEGYKIISPDTVSR